MFLHSKTLLFALLLGVSPLLGRILIPMDTAQNDHLKAYGIAFSTLKRDIRVEWLLNYRGGSFVMDDYDVIRRDCLLRNVTFTTIDDAQYTQILAVIEDNNMDHILLEKAPKIAVYSPPSKLPWDDAVTLVLTYAEIPYTVIYDTEVLQGRLADYDWLHLHHEDFTGQYGKFYRSYRNAAWYITDQKTQEALAASLGYGKVSLEKRAVALKIRDYVAGGGFMFAMCSATDSYDIALATLNVDAVAAPFDGDGIDADFAEKLDYSQTLAFEKFTIYPDPNRYEYSDIDIPPSDKPLTLNAATDYFSLFEFSAKWDPVPTMLTQNHSTLIKGFMGQTTGFDRNFIKKHVIIMGETENTDRVRYIHGNYGKGTFTFYGGHDPEDYRHFVGDPPTNLELHRNSPGYRLILNNILFPAAKKKKQKT